MSETTLFSTISLDNVDMTAYLPLFQVGLFLYINKCLKKMNDFKIMVFRLVKRCFLRDLLHRVLPGRIREVTRKYFY